MNKKFTTLLASAMLVSAFSVGTVAAYVGTAAIPFTTEVPGLRAADVNETVAPKKGEAVLLQTNTTLGSEEFLGIGKGTAFLSVEKGKGFTLTDLNSVTWTVSERKSVLGETVYSFVNKTTNLPFAVDPSLAVAAVKKDDKVDTKETAKKVKEATVVTLGGSATEWVVKEVGASKTKTLVSYVDGSTYVYLATRESDKKMILVKGTEITTGISTLAIGLNQGNIPTELKLGAKDLNTLLQSTAENFFHLNMTPEVTTGKKNLLTATDLVADDKNATEGYVRLQAKGQKKDDAQLYVVVDTAYYGGTETDGSLLTYKYDTYGPTNEDGTLKDTEEITGTEDPTKKYTTLKNGRLKGSYEYKFTYNAVKNELYVQVNAAMHQVPKNAGETDAEYNKRIKESFNNAKWQTADNVKEDKYIYMASLDGVNVLSLNTDKTDGTTDTKSATATSQNVTIKIGTNFVGLKPTTIADGVYTVKYKAKKGNENFDKNGTYALANLAGDFGWAEQAKRQDFNRMPAAQWVVKKNGTSTTAPVTINNREFSDLNAENCLPKIATQFYAVEGSDDVFYYNGNDADTLSFVKVADELVKDAKLGYKYVSANEAKVQTYTFNYLSGLAFDKYLYTPAGKDSIVRVDEKDGKSNFRLTLIVKDDKYGYEDGLVRNAYYVSDGKGRYISYDKDRKKYMMMSEPTLFFLKENNSDDGKHYYALVKAETRTQAVGHVAYFTPEYEGKEVEAGKIEGKELSKVQLEKETPLYDKNRSLLVKDHSEIKKAYVYALNDDNNKVVFKEIELTESGNDKFKYDSKVYATVKVSVDDNTLDLTEGKLNDKFDDGTNNEIRTSAFAVEVDNSPLYRRFNNVALGENVDDKADSLMFKETVRGEYLMDEWNKALRDANVNYAGIWSKDKAEGKLAFIIDTTWVERGAGKIKPQYLISVAREDQASTPGVPCTYEHNHFDNAGNQVTAAECSHATPAHPGFRYGKYLVNFSDSAKACEADVNPYLFSTKAASNSSYTRVGFVKAVQAGDSLFILTNGLENVKPSELTVKDIIANYTKAKINEKYIVNLKGDKHKNVTWSFRYINPDKAATVTEEGADNSFLFESNVYGAKDSQYQTVEGDENKSIAPEEGAAWLKMHNGCLVLTDSNSAFNGVKTGGDGALVFNAYQKDAADDMVTSNDEVAVEGVSVIAGNGTVTVQGAAGKSIVITNILGKVVAETVLTSDNATIAVPAGIVAVAVDGEEAVKAIVK